MHVYISQKVDIEGYIIKDNNNKKQQIKNRWSHCTLKSDIHLFKNWCRNKTGMAILRCKTDKSAKIFLH